MDDSELSLIKKTINFVKNDECLLLSLVNFFNWFPWDHLETFYNMKFKIFHFIYVQH